MTKKDELVITRFPKSFLKEIDIAKAKAGYNSRERSKFLRDLLQDKSFKELLENRRKPTRRERERFGL